MCGPLMSRPRRRWDRQCEGFPCIVGCGGYREIPLILGATAVGGVGCGRLGATVVLHARCTPKITHHLRADGSGPMRAPNRIRKRPSSAGLPLPGLCWLSFRRAIDDGAQRRPSWTGARSRTPQLLVGSLGDPSRSTQRLLADRSAHVCPLCVQAIRRSTSTTCTGPPGIRGCTGV
jgi:hypothetical protein